MSLKEQIKTELKESLKEKNELRTSVLKMLLSSVQNLEIQLGKKEEGLSEEEILKAVKSEAKKREDSIEAFTKAGRDELAQKEKEELEILKKYLPEEMGDEKLQKITEEAIAETGASSAADFGKAMKKAMEKTQGKADGKRVSELVKKFLNI